MVKHLVHTLVSDVMTPSVLDANRELVGLVTESDIFRAIVKKWRDDNILTAGI